MEASSLLSSCWQVIAVAAFTLGTALDSSSNDEPYTFTTLAGPPARSTNVRLVAAYDFAIDGKGDFYVADFLYHTIRRFTPLGDMTILAGSVLRPGSADGAGSDAQFSSPSGVAVDGAYNVYVADSANHAIRKVTPTGVVTTLAGRAGTSGSADGPGSDARFNSPSRLAVDGKGNVYVLDSGNYTIRKVTPTGMVTTLAGQAGSSGSADGTGSDARFGTSSGFFGSLAVDSVGTVYVADKETIRTVTPSGVTTTLAGLAGHSGFADGIGNSALFDSLTGVAVDAQGNVFVTDQSNPTIRKVTPTGIVTTLAGSPAISGFVDGIGGAARFYRLVDIETDSAGNCYVLERDRSLIRQMTPTGVVTTLTVLVGNAGFNDGSADTARFYEPLGVAVHKSGNVYVADSQNHTIRKVTPEGAVTTLAGLAQNPGLVDGTGGAARFLLPSGVAVDAAESVYVAEPYSSVIRKITSAGVVTTLAGRNRGSADGTGRSAQFNFPTGVAVDSSENVYVADSGNQTKRKVSPSGGVTTLAGLAGNAGSLDGTGSEARFSGPSGIAVDSVGNVYVADPGNNAIRKVTPEGVVTTFAGLPGTRGSADGAGSAARFYGPASIALDDKGNLFVADSLNNLIRKVTPLGKVSTLAGDASKMGQAGQPGGGYADGVGSAAWFNLPSGVAVGSSGTIFVADSRNNTIRMGVPATSNPQSVVVSLQAIPPTQNQPFQIAVHASSGQRITIQASSDLVRWVTVGSFNQSSTILNIMQSDSGVFSHRFYRASFPPPPPSVAVATNLVWIPPGTFVMGSPLTDRDRETYEGPLTTVTLTRGFWMSDHEVTQAEYADLLIYYGDLAGSYPSAFQFPFLTDDRNRPVEEVTWEDAVQYCLLLTAKERKEGHLPSGYEYRLPTEAEWEYACRAGSTTRYSYGDDLDYVNLSKYAWYGDNFGHKNGPTRAVGQKLPNPWGLFDIYGNVSEWCADWFAPSYPGGEVFDPTGPATGTEHVFRGGDFEAGGWLCRSAQRESSASRAEYIGFRIVLAPIR